MPSIIDTALIARKSSIGSTNNQWGMNKTPTDYSFTLYVLKEE